MLHGIYGSCPIVQPWVDMISESLNHSTVVKCLEIGNGANTSVFTPVQDQADVICDKLHSDPDYAGKEINLLGISQGGLIARSVVETCPDLKINVLYTFGTPHGGVSVYHHCQKWYCPFINHVLGYLAGLTELQGSFAPADYFRAWWDLDRYYEKTEFLTRINNEHDIKVAEYKERLSSVKKFGLWMWEQDTVVVPRDSEWFSVWDSGRNLVPLKEQSLYTDGDYIGLKALYEAGNMFFYSGQGEHVSLEQYMIDDYLRPLLMNETPMPSQY